MSSGTRGRKYQFSGERVEEIKFENAFYDTVILSLQDGNFRLSPANASTYSALWCTRVFFFFSGECGFFKLRNRQRSVTMTFTVEISKSKVRHRGYPGIYVYRLAFCGR